ncbi:MAG TPA: tRNA pseudouridine(38-40) synthase TruA [Turneriella sp.]|nr:tRNA pseudouridine(38-40) synthase TruA [Turneriella sp.]
MKIALTIEYDGAPFYGFQIQNHQDSVQAQLEKALYTVLRQNVRVYCAGRTDTGVNALGQVVHFATENVPPMQRLVYALNSILPRTIAVRHGALVPEDFHARFSCTAREYVYMIYNAPYRSTTLGYKVLWLRDALNWDFVRDAIPHLVGERNFAAFTRVALVKSGEKTRRRIDAIHVVVKGRMVYIHICGSGFLHNMIRILVGTLVDVARGKIQPEKVASIVASANRLEASVTLPPNALYFLHAQYNETDYNQSEAQHDLRKWVIENSGDG